MSPPNNSLKVAPPPTEGNSGTLLPVFLKLAGRKVLVVGGGPVATAKIGGLEGTGAEILVVAPDLIPALRARLGRDGGQAPAVGDAGGVAITLAERAFQPSDLDGAWLVIAAAPPEVNRQVAAAAALRRIFVVAVDDPPAGSAYGAGIIRRGGVTVAISTDGHAPALAGLLREGLDAVIPRELEAWLDEARALRPGWRAEAVPMGERRPRLLAALNQLYAGRGDGGRT